MQAIWNNKVKADVEDDKIIRIEGNSYFPPESIMKEYFKPSGKHTTCFWKGQASYYHLDVDGQKYDDGAWYYPDPMPSSLGIVKKDYRDYVAFWHGIKTTKN